MTGIWRYEALLKLASALSRVEIGVDHVIRVVVFEIESLATRTTDGGM